MDINNIMNENIKKITLTGLFYNALDRFGSQIITTLVGIITARLLSVSDFAVLATLSVFSTIATSLVDSGLATSLVRTKDVEDVDFSSMFGFNLFVSAVIYLLLFFSAPYIERFYGIANLSIYARVLFLQLLINAFGIVQYVKVLKSTQFNITARVNLISMVVSGAAVICMAYLNYGAWVLVLQPVLYSLFRTGMFWYWGDWNINFVFSSKSLKKHLNFSLSFMTANLIGKILSPLYGSFIGKFYTNIETGYYYQANKWGETPNLLISSIIQGTTLSTLVPIQDDFPRFLNACRKTIATLAFVLFPASFLAVSIANSGFILMLTDKYESAILYFQLLCLGGVFISLTDLNVSFINIKGKSKYALFLEIFKISFAFISLFLTIHLGILVIVYGQIIVRCVCYLLSTQFSKNIYGYGLMKQFQDILPSLLISIIAGFFSYLPFYFSVVEDLKGMLVIQMSIFIIIYISLNHFFSNVIWMEILQLVKGKFSKK